MALLNQPTQVASQTANLLETLKEGQPPEKFNRQFLKDIGFKSSNHFAFISLLKGLGFLTADGSPTQRYRDFIDGTQSKKIMREAVKEAYGDIFTIKAKPTKADKKLISGKYKSAYNSSENSADRAASTFLALWEWADDGSEELPSVAQKEELAPNEPEKLRTVRTGATERSDAPASASLHYNIQVHLPATKDLEVYNAIFKSIREHLLD